MLWCFHLGVFSLENPFVDTCSCTVCSSLHAPQEVSLYWCNRQPNQNLWALELTVERLTTTVWLSFILFLSRSKCFRWVNKSIKHTVFYTSSMPLELPSRRSRETRQTAHLLGRSRAKLSLHSAVRKQTQETSCHSWGAGAFTSEPSIAYTW